MGDEDKLRSRIAELEATVAKLEAALGVKTLNPPPEAIAWAEGVFAEEDDKRARIAELEATVAKAFLVLGEVAEALVPFENWMPEVLDNPNVPDDWSLVMNEDVDVPLVEVGHLRKAKAVRERIMDLCHADPVPGGETSSPPMEAPQSGDGETR